jgi:hypothetical protein
MISKQSIVINITEHNNTWRMHYKRIGMNLKAIDDNENDLTCEFYIGEIAVSVFFSPETSYDSSEPIMGHIEVWNPITKERVDNDYILSLIYNGELIWSRM